MKTPEQINIVRTKLIKVLQMKGLSTDQKALFGGMLNSLVWVMDAEQVHPSTIERLLANEPIAVGQTGEKAFRRLDEFNRRNEN